MIIIEGNKSALYQWDLNQRIILTSIPNIAAGIEVHFDMNNDSEECCPIAPTYKEGDVYYADVPNNLLQQSGVLLAYLTVQSADKVWTEYSTEILVLPRKKPANYVYTETEIKSWDALCEKFDNETKLVNEVLVEVCELQEMYIGGDVR